MIRGWVLELDSFDGLVRLKQISNGLETLHVRSTTLNREERGLASSVLHSFRTLLGISSGPVALSEFTFLRNLVMYLALKAMLSLVLDGSCNL